MSTVTVTWWGHSTATIELDSRRILTDPVLTRRIGHLSRIGGPVPAARAREADLVVISHLHHDHLHVPSLRLLGPKIPLLAPAGAWALLERIAPELAPRVREVSPGERLDVAGVHVRIAHANHDGRRSAMSRHAGPAVGYILERGGTSVWFAGDTGLFAAMVELAPVDLALVPIGGWGPTLGPTHLDPAQAAEAARLVGAADVVPIHYGTLWPTGLRRVHTASFRRSFIDPPARFTEALDRVAPQSRAHVLSPGTSITITGPGL
jgi:L-ascorbate metabolism protein UlaG (beta-lactamase superfamily)